MPCETRTSRYFFGVNVHFQNGIAKNKIRYLRESDQTKILHAINQWPQAISVTMWPYYLRYACYLKKYLPLPGGALSPTQILTWVDVDAKMKHFHNFGCPVYALHNSLQGNMSTVHWEYCAQLEINLGFSSRQKRTIYNVTNINTGVVSPQLHV